MQTAEGKLYLFAAIDRTSKCAVSHIELRTHLIDFMIAHNFARRLKTLTGLTPYEKSPKFRLQSQSVSSSDPPRCRD